jgi:hypothetical protein
VVEEDCDVMQTRDAKVVENGSDALHRSFLERVLT